MTTTTPEFSDFTFKMYFDWCQYHSTNGGYCLQELLISKSIKLWWHRMMRAREPIILDVLYNVGYMEVWEDDFLTKQWSKSNHYLYPNPLLKNLNKNLN
ncbi:hypothetical protein N8Z33_00905 [Flavobacteriaceae bacterium]|nr:hypothetical protein [Flavobacteriaceae bacterium]